MLVFRHPCPRERILAGVSGTLTQAGPHSSLAIYIYFFNLGNEKFGPESSNQISSLVSLSSDDF